MDNNLAALLCLPFVIAPLILLIAIVVNRVQACRASR